MPADFGLVGMVMVFSGVAGIFANFGFKSALVQRQGLAERHLHAVFWFNLLIGAALTVIFIASAPLLADFFHTAALVQVTRAMAFSFLLGAFSIVPGALLQRQMRFATLTKIEVGVTLGCGAVGATMAFLGCGVWSLVANMLLTTACTSAALMWAAGYRPRWTFDRAAIRELFGYSTHLVGANLINYGARNADNLIIGKLLGAASLGIYSRAYNLMLLPITQVISVLSEVMFSTFCSIQDDRPRIKRIYLRAMAMIGAISFPVVLGLWAVADPFVLSFFGPQWVEVAPLLQILLLVSVTQCLAAPVGWIYTSQGKTNWLMWWNVFGGGAVILGILVGAYLGTLKAFAWCYLASNAVIFYPCIAIPGKLIGMTFGEVMTAVLSPLLLSVTMAGGVYLLGWALPAKWPVGVQLLIQVTTGVIVYVVLLLVFRPQAYRDMWQLIAEKWTARKTRLSPQPIAAGL